jgi:ferric-dicitrate binding protein FerR (iron transport regulator)/DNA-directed RNA polymerase specialized sigma24 family protein
MSRRQPTQVFDITDAGLVRRLSSGDAVALGLLVHRYGGRITSLFLRLSPDRSQEEAERLCHQTFLAFGEAAQGATDDGHVRLRILVIAFAKHRKATRRQRTRDLLHRGFPRPAIGSDDFAAVLAAMPARYREVLILGTTERLDPDQLSEVLNVPLHTVRHRLRKAHQLIQPGTSPTLRRATLVSDSRLDAWADLRRCRGPNLPRARAIAAELSVEARTHRTTRRYKRQLAWIAYMAAILSTPIWWPEPVDVTPSAPQVLPILEPPTWEAQVLHQDGAMITQLAQHISVPPGNRLVLQLGPDRLGLSSDTELIVERADAQLTRLRLDRGALGVQVAAREPGADFVVLVGDVQVWGVGTQFGLHHQPEFVDVQVIQGDAEVQGPGFAWTVQAGHGLRIEATGEVLRELDPTDNALAKLLRTPDERGPGADLAPSTETTLAVLQPSPLSQTRTLQAHAAYRIAVSLQDQARHAEALAHLEALDQNPALSDALRPDAMLRLGQTQLAVDRYTAGQETLAGVVDRFPGTRAAQAATDLLLRTSHDQIPGNSPP